LQLEEVKKERNKHDVTVDNNNLFKEKDAQISFLISQLQSVKDQKDQLEKQLEKVSASDQHLIRKKTTYLLDLRFPRRSASTTTTSTG
jgi:cell shape-determining protein MreC